MFAYAPYKSNKTTNTLFRKIEVPIPNPQDHDLLIEIKAISVNPVDFKIAASCDDNPANRILGWDASGIVVAKGKLAHNFQLGDEVFYAGALNRQGSNAQYQLVDERIVAKKPKNLSFNEAAAIPLTAITAYEALFNQLNLDQITTNSREKILLIGAAGGVGSIAIQLLKKLSNAIVIATASRPESMNWVKSLGADIIINHSNNLVQELAAHDIKAVDKVFCINGLDEHFINLAAITKPFGKICAIDDPKEKLDMLQLKWKSISFCWEFMFTHSMFQTENMQSQGNILHVVSNMLEAGSIKSTLANDLGKMSSENLAKAHALSESRKTLGKIVLSV